MSRRILVVEDERDLANIVASRLRSEGFEVEVRGDGTQAVECFNTWHPDLVVLDLNLPGMDGIEVCRRIQQRGHVPVVMVTARDDETDVLIGLGVGADDYLTKPFSPRELAARVHAVLRRAEVQPAGHTRFVHDEIMVDEATRQVSASGEPVHLTPTEFDLLLTLLKAGGAVLTRDRLLAEVWGYRDGSGARTVDSHVRALRRKLGDGLIRTVHGVGYASTWGERTR